MPPSVEEEYVQVAEEFYDYPLTLTNLIKWGVDTFPEQEVVYAPPDAPKLRLTFTQVWDRVRRLASALEQLGVKPGDPKRLGTRVGALEWNSHRYLELYYAVPGLGAVLHTANIRYSPEDLAYTINHAGDEILFVKDEFIPLLQAILPRLKTVKKIVIMTDKTEPPQIKLEGFEVYNYEDLIRSSSPYDFRDINERTVATLFYTSGTTGPPKGVFFTHRQLVLHAMGLAISTSAPPYELSIKDVVMPLVPMYHVHAWGGPHAMFLAGQKYVFTGRMDWGYILKTISEEKVTYIYGVPVILYLLLTHPDSPKYDLRGLKYGNGGSAIPEGLYKLARSRGIIVINGYGLSETAPVIAQALLRASTLNWPEDKKENYFMKGLRQIPLVFLKVVDPTGKEVPKDGKTLGELVVRAPWLTPAYFKDPEKTRDLWRGGWLHTGDVAVWDSDGHIWIMDRLKDVIKSGGEWIVSTRLEDLISTHPGVGEVAVVGVPHPKW
ncbi:MAG: long-chain-fatty-acid--CoA ligase, partial [Vulcanisaeta sp.]|nr:long-chain-fatty-acid--CoA ligase [Vulcanisaeta sp.]